MTERVIVIHGEKQLKIDIDNYCRRCSIHRSDWCNFKNQRACKKVQTDFKGRLHGELREMYVFHPTMIKVEA